MSNMFKVPEMRAWFSPAYAEIQVFVMRKDSEGEFIGLPVVMKKLEGDQRHVHFEPTFRLHPEVAQVLMDDLWRCGLRPTEGKGSAGALAATQRHLEDLRTIAFVKLGIEIADRK